MKKKSPMEVLIEFTTNNLDKFVDIELQEELEDYQEAQLVKSFQEAFSRLPVLHRDAKNTHTAVRRHG